MPNTNVAIPREPTQEMLMAGRKQCAADCLGEHMGPNVERIWKVMHDAALSAISEGTGDQIDRLAEFIMHEVPGEPSENEGAGDTAIRVIRSLQARLAEVEGALRKIADGTTIEEDDDDGPVTVWADADELREIASAALTGRAIGSSQ